jgi:lipopolysaccharide transport system ATP-binding protein
MPSSPPSAIDDTGIAIRVTGVSKSYRIYERPRDRLLQSFWGSRKQLFREFQALDDVSFDVYRGETVGIIGLNGSGKSTLLQLIAGTLTATEGEIQTNGKVSALLQLGAGFNPEFTGRENIDMVAAIHGLTDSEIRQRYAQIAAYADIGDFVERPVKTYSSGMYVRLAFAVAISVEPDVLIVDEALAVGDMGFQAKCMVTLHEMQKRGVSILLVSHDISTVRSLCGRALYLKQGRAVEFGPASEIVDRYIREVQEANHDAGAAAGQSPNGPIDGEPAILPPARSAQFQRFAEMANHCRSGTGDVRVMYAEMLGENGLVVTAAEFGERVAIRIVVEATRTCTFSVNYKICDKNRTPVIGADFLMQNQGLLTLQPGQQAEIVYRTPLPLTDGKYSLRISLTHPINAHQLALFFDIVEIAHLFEMRRNSTAKFWTQVYLPNALEITVS